MIVVELKGGMGNQMFQYAIARYLSLKHGSSMAFDLRFLNDRTPRDNFVFRNYDLDVFQISSNSPPGKNRSSFKLKLLKFLGLESWFFKKLSRAEEQTFHFDHSLLEIKDNSYVTGYFQSPKYFASIDTQIRKDFSLDHIFGNSKIQALKAEILSSNSVCVNIRRTDFVNLSSAISFHGFCGEEYMREAVKVLSSKVTNPHYFVFSDDVEWCIDNLKFLEPCTFVDHSYAGTKFGEYLMLMSSCKHFCIPNSTFAWWAAYLAKNPDKVVIAPKTWFAADGLDTGDLIPNSWIRV